MSAQAAPSFTSFFCEAFVSGVIEKGFFGGRFVRAEAYYAANGAIYENGAILGRAMRDKPLSVEQILGRPPEPGKLIGVTKSQALKRRSENPDPIASFFTYTLRSLLKEHYPPSAKQLREKVPFDEQWWGYTQTMCYEGIGFGLLWPDETVRIYESSRAEAAKAWNEAKRAGVQLSTDGKFDSFAVQERLVLDLTLNYVKRNAPHLIADFSA